MMRFMDWKFGGMIMEIGGMKSNSKTTFNTGQRFISSIKKRYV